LISEKEQRWGAATLPSDAKDIGSVAALRQNVQDQHQSATDKEWQTKYEQHILLQFLF